MENQSLNNEGRPIPQQATSNRICSCSHPWKSALINLNGDVHACPHGSAVLGNLNDTTFEEIWSGSTIRSMREHIKKGKQHPACRSSECPFQIDSAGSAQEEEWITFPADPGSNKELVTSEYQRGALNVSNQPAMLTVAVTSKCDLKCVMCPHGMGRVHAFQDLSVDAMSKLAKPLQAAERVDITGVGEPFLSKSFWSFVDWQPRVPGQFVLFKTSGLHITEANARKIVNSAASEISISLDASESSTYQKIRGGDFSQALQGVRSLVEARKRSPSSSLRICINMTLMRENIEELEAFVHLGKQLKVDEVVAYQLFSFGDTPVWVVSRDDWEFRYSEQMLKHFPELASKKIKAAFEVSKEIDIPLNLECRTKDYLNLDACTTR